MKQAAAMLGCDASDLKRLKAGGSQAFKHGRVNVAMVRKELDALPPAPVGDELETKDILERRKLRAQYLKEEHRLAVEQKRFLPVEDVRRDVLRIGAALRAELLRFIGDVPNWEGIAAAEMSQRAKKTFDTICASLSDETSKLYA